MARLFVLILFLGLNAGAAESTFLRAINLNGPALVIGGRAWEGQDTTNLVVTGNAFENQAVRLKPPTDRARATMIRSSRWGAKVDVELTGLVDGPYQVFLYVWEDNHSERFDLLVNDQVVLEGFHSGETGSWRKLGPWQALPRDGRIKVTGRAASHGAANLSGIELWAGDGPIPAEITPQFVTTPTPEQLEFFERRIRPILVESCYECHSVGAEKIKGGLVLDSRSGVMKGGDTGPAITPGDPDASLLIQAVRHASDEIAMPPKSRLSAEQVADLEAWVRMGAPDPRMQDTVATVKAKSAIDWDKAREWWSFRAIASPEVPAVRDTSWPASDVDRFILARLEQKNLAPAEDADRRAWIRRATFDLIGLPPTPAEVEAFVRDPAPDAFAKVVDRLLDRPQYGERWGRYWLDVVRYADTAGDNSDFPIPQMYRYRDWVISAYNRDLPYDEFVRHQLAGDLLPGGTSRETQERLIATGYLANARRFGSRVDDYPQHLTIEDTIDNLGRAFLGLTVSCARCHDHKFDPITAADYYALYGIFHSTRYPWPGIELDQQQRDLVPLVSASEVEAARKVHAEEQASLDAAVKQLEREIKELASAEAGAGTADARSALEKSLDKAKKAADRHRRTPLPIEMAYAVGEAARIENVPVQHKGDPAKPGEVVPRGFLTILNGAHVPPEDTSSGRLRLAGWITDPANPLTARVMVNRIWLHHFGRGLVATPNDFGRQGKGPTHPELLDWLAARFVAEKWSVKAMHRIIMLSRTYQLSSQRPAAALEADPGNELLGSFPRRRLDAEALRDTLLFLGGNLELTACGPHPFPAQPDWKFTQHNPFRAVYETSNRSVYLMTQRIQRHPYLAIFDGADPAASTPVRTTSTTPLQALYLLNDPFVHAQSKGFASRLMETASDDAGRVVHAYRLALGRPPESDEVEDALQFLDAVRTRLAADGRTESESKSHSESGSEAEAWRAFSRALFRLNEFAYLD